MDYLRHHPEKPAPVTRPRTTAKPEFSCGGPYANFKGWRGTCQAAAAAAHSMQPFPWKGTLVVIGLVAAALCGLESKGAGSALCDLADNEDATVISNELENPQVTNTKLQNIVNDLYKAVNSQNRVGNGTTADAVRNEIETGQPTGGTFHFQKTEEYSNGLKRLLKNGDLNYHDKVVAQSLLNELNDVLGKTP